MLLLKKKNMIYFHLQIQFHVFAQWFELQHKKEMERMSVSTGWHTHKTALPLTTFRTSLETS